MANSIGKMRYRVKVERATNTRDAGGGISQAFNPVTFIYANIKTYKRHKLLQAGYATRKGNPRSNNPLHDKYRY